MPSFDVPTKSVRRRLADGTIKEYRYAKRVKSQSPYAPDCISALVIAYRRSPEWTGLKPSSRKNYAYYLRDIEEIGTVAVKDVRRKTLLAMRDAIARHRGPGAANVFIRTATILLGWAREREWIEHSPLQRVKALPGGHLAAWTTAEADAAIASSDLPEPLRRAVILARYTGQRRGDLVAMTWRDYDDTAIRVRQQKGGVVLSIPVARPLKVALDEWKKSVSSTHILTSMSGRPWQPNRLTQSLSVALPRIGLRGELNIHGLRKLAAAELANVGCSAHEIAAITGHRTLAMVQLYTASASQARLSQAAILRLENGGGKR